MWRIKSWEKRLSIALLAPCIGSFLLWLSRAYAVQDLQYGFIFWNLFLAWVPLILALVFTRLVHAYGLRDYKSFVVLLLWFVFLPNSFYVVTDLIHLNRLSNYHLLLDITFLTLFVIAGLGLGFSSLAIIQHTLLKRITVNQSFVAVFGAIFASSFAIYLGRYLRWNTWDVIANPSGILFDISERVLNPLSHSRTFSTTIIFTFFLLCLYVPVYEFLKYTKNKQR